MKNYQTILLCSVKCAGLPIVLLICFTKTYSQECSGPAAVKDSMWIESVKGRIKSLQPGLPDTGLLKNQISADSVKNKVTQKFDTLKSSLRKVFQKDSTKQKRDPLIYFQQGYVQYNLNYRSRIDTPFAENNIVQHLAMVNGQFIIAGAVPVNVSYIDRESNSSLFMDYRDVRVDINGPELQRLQKEKLRQNLLRQVQRLEDSSVLPAMQFNQFKMDNLKGFLTNPKLVETLIQSKENIINLSEQDPSCKWSDSVEIYSRKFIDLYETKQAEIKSLENRLDSLQELYASTRKKIQTITKIINGKFNTGEGIADIRKYLRDAGIDENRLPQLAGFLYSLQRLSLGRTMPDMSPLTVKNVNVKGINAAFGNGIWYTAFTAGLVDYRIRDFVYGKGNASPQYVYAAKAGVGKTGGNHFYIIGYKGEKQIYSLNSPSSGIMGVSAELQYVWWKNHRLSAEVAQSSVPPVVTTTQKNTVFNFRDLTGRAYHLQWSSYFPGLKANLEGFYQKTGINFQSFNSYAVNAAAESWALKYNQYFFNRELRIDAGVRTNDFSNPLIIQNYKSNTVFKTLQATFKKRGLPAVSVGYIPSSQYAVIDSQVYESRYQTFTVNVNHSYKVGIAKGITNVFYSRFYNSSNDSGFVYYNANYVSVYQQLVFRSHVAMLGVNLTRNSQFTLGVYQAGSSTILFRKLQIEGGVKINHFNNSITKTGLYGKARLMTRWLGDFSAWYDDSYLPGIGQQLIRNQQVNIGFIRRIK